MFYTIYQIKNVVNGKIYIGMHQTKDLNDSYMGSGLKLRNAYNKYGFENFKKEILFILDSREEMIQKEKELVTEEFCRRQDTYNICIGGHGGGIRKGAVLSDETKQKISNTNKIVMQDKEIRQKISESAKQRVWNQDFKDKTSKRVSNTIWIKKDNETKMIQPEELEKHIKEGWIKGRVMNNGMKNPEIAKKCGAIRKRSLTLDGVTYGDYKKAAAAIEKSPSYVQGLVKEGRAMFGEKGSGF
jgi:hypothetical protein